MDAERFRQILNILNVTQVTASRLLGVTTRSVNAWAVGQTEIPGPVSAYLELLASVPIPIRVTELARVIEQPETSMNGMYGVEITTPDGGYGKGVLVFKDGTIFGVDEGGVTYDGHYSAKGIGYHVDIDVLIPAGTGTVFSQHPTSREIRFPVNFDMATVLIGGRSTARTPLGDVFLRMQRLRNLPA